MWGKTFRMIYFTINIILRWKLFPNEHIFMNWKDFLNDCIVETNISSLRHQKYIRFSERQMTAFKICEQECHKPFFIQWKFDTINSAIRINSAIVFKTYSHLYNVVQTVSMRLQHVFSDMCCSSLRVNVISYHVSSSSRFSL